MQKPPLNVHAGVYRGTRCLNVGLCLHVYNHTLCRRASTPLSSLRIWAYSPRQCNKYQKVISFLVLVPYTLSSKTVSFLTIFKRMQNPITAINCLTHMERKLNLKMLLPNHDDDDDDDDEFLCFKLTFNMKDYRAACQYANFCQ